MLNFGDAASKGSGMLKKALPYVLAAVAGGGALALAPAALDWLKSKSTNPAVAQPVATQPTTGGPAVSVGGVAYTLGLEVKDTP